MLMSATLNNGADTSAGTHPDLSLAPLYQVSAQVDLFASHPYPHHPQALLIR
jgi:hypothetical protein